MRYLIIPFVFLFFISIFFCKRNNNIGIKKSNNFVFEKYKKKLKNFYLLKDKTVYRKIIRVKEETIIKKEISNQYYEDTVFYLYPKFNSTLICDNNEIENKDFNFNNFLNKNLPGSSNKNIDENQNNKIKKNESKVKINNISNKKNQSQKNEK